jgi:hypothetical protein
MQWQREIKHYTEYERLINTYAPKTGGELTFANFLNHYTNNLCEIGIKIMLLKCQITYVVFLYIYNSAISNFDAL